ncbi:hypothetical protein BSL82_03485 [Tardibacter chloracetimidivorans]|uniref:Uncharacterized protein n=1 Tax=Tardibacter chloracetimidivorans TaxID=1921510 RepID=A0A1L3ZS93_9SPHN|nr:hypothetical protein [Tardibacter chloracetimidivorans]API58480.1 hypothetical protein BSL82_03485 [Tardibacter chloracetimidivorans]
MTIAPVRIVDLYREAQVNEDMDAGTYVGGTDSYGVSRILEAIAEMAGWVLPRRMNLKEREKYLLDAGRADEIEYLGAMGDE